MSSSETGNQSHPPSTIGIVAAYSKPEAQLLAVDIERYLVEQGITVIPESALPPAASETVDAIIVLGGDGLMMRSAKSYPDVPLLGINFGKVGFLAHVERDDWQKAIDSLLAGDYTIQESSTLEATLETDRGSVDQGWAINDVVIRSGVRMIDIELYVNGFYVNTYPGDGMIASTSRGSTAYCMAAGGPILTVGVQGFALVPISCHSPIRTPLVVEESAQIDMFFTSRHDASLILDGRITSELAPDDVVSIKRGVHMCRLISVSNIDFYEAFRTKFNFRIRPDALPTRNQRPRPGQITTD